MNGRGLGEGGPMTMTTAMADVVTAIAGTRGLDLRTVGAHTRVDNPPHPALHIKVVDHNLVLVAHYARVGHKRLAVPQALYFTGYGAARGWVPVSLRHDLQGIRQHCTTVAHGTPIGYVPHEVRAAAAWADRWAQTLRAQGFVEAAQLHDETTDCD